MHTKYKKWVEFKVRITSVKQVLSPSACYTDWAEKP